jgi:hypothetical protein
MLYTSHIKGFLLLIKLESMQYKNFSLQKKALTAKRENFAHAKLLL